MCSVREDAQACAGACEDVRRARRRAKARRRAQRRTSVCKCARRYAKVRKSHRLSRSNARAARSDSWGRARDLGFRHPVKQGASPRAVKRVIIGDFCASRMPKARGCWAGAAHAGAHGHWAHTGTECARALSGRPARRKRTSTGRAHYAPRVRGRWTGARRTPRAHGCWAGVPHAEAHGRWARVHRSKK